MTPEPTRGGDPSREQEKGGLETPEQVIAQSEAMLRKAAEEGVEDYSLVILDAVYEGYRRNLDALKNATREEKKAWEHEALYGTYPRGWLIWNDAHGSDLSDEDNEVARIIARRAIEVENEQANRIRSSKNELDYNTAYFKNGEWMVDVNKILYPDLDKLPDRLMKFAEEQKVVKKADNIQDLLDFIGEMRAIRERIKDNGNKSLSSVRKELGKLKKDMRSRISMKKESVRYSDEDAFRDTDNPTRYSAVGMIDVPIPIAKLDISSPLKKYIEGQQSLMDHIESVGRDGIDALLILGTDAEDIFEAYDELREKESK